MARIRTVKPEFFTHEALSQLTLEAHFIAAGLLTHADDEGYFNANPKLVKAALCPLRDSLNIHGVLTELSSIGWITIAKTDDGRLFGLITGFTKHQRVNRPTPSKISNLGLSFGSHTFHGGLTEDSPPERKGKERNGKGREVIAQPLADANAETGRIVTAPTAVTWEHYREAYQQRYQQEPVRNPKVNSILKMFVERIGSEEAPKVAAFYVTHNSSYYVQRGHAVECLLKDAEKLRTEWANGRPVTTTQARQQDQTAARGNVARELIEELRAGTWTLGANKSN